MPTPLPQRSGPLVTLLVLCALLGTGPARAAPTPEPTGTVRGTVTFTKTSRNGGFSSTTIVLVTGTWRPVKYQDGCAGSAQASKSAKVYMPMEGTLRYENNWGETWTGDASELSPEALEELKKEPRSFRTVATRPFRRPGPGEKSRYPSFLSPEGVNLGCFHFDAGARRFIFDNPRLNVMNNNVPEELIERQSWNAFGDPLPTPPRRQSVESLWPGDTFEAAYDPDATTLNGHTRNAEVDRSDAESHGQEDHEHQEYLIHWELTVDDETGLRIVSPRPLSEHVFRKGKLELDVEAEVNPPGLAGQVEWELEARDGTRTRLTPKKGAKAKLVLEGLPRRNADFGPRKLIARLKGRTAETSVRLFFERDGRDNPEGKQHPNWFYYWRQGVVPHLDTFQYDAKETLGRHDIQGDRHLVVGAQAWTELPGATLPLKNCPKGQVTTRTTVGVESVAAIVAHELEHKRLVEAKRGKADWDKDLVPDHLEGGPLCLNTADRNTHGLDPKHMNVSQPPPLASGKQESAKERRARERYEAYVAQLTHFGDNELLATAAEGNVQADTAQDWAFPGAQASQKR